MKRVSGIGGVSLNHLSFRANAEKSLKLARQARTKTDKFATLRFTIQKMGGEGFEPPTLSV